MALQPRVNVDVQLVDERGKPLLASVTPQATELGRLLGAGPAAVRAALAACLRTRTPHGVTLDGMQVVCIGLPAGPHGRGALVLSRRLVERGPSPQQVRGELELLGLWLSGSVAAHLASAPVVADGVERLTVLGRMLGDVAVSGSDRDLVGRFADVLAVWHDIELYGYVDTGHGTFAREVALPGADLTKVPETIDAAGLPDVAEVRPLARGETEALGFSSAHEVLAARFTGADAAHTWLLLMITPNGGHDPRRLGAFVTLLAQSAAQAAAASSARVVSGMAERLMDRDGDPSQALAAALGVLRDELHARAVSLVASAVSGAPLTRVTVPPGATAEEDATGRDVSRLALVRRVPDEYTMVLAIAHAQGRAITPHERYVAQAAADIVQKGVRQNVRYGYIGERRASGRSFRDVLERLAQQTLERGSTVSAIVMSADTRAGSRPGTTQRCVARIRGSLRPADLVGMLGEGEVVLLLPDTAAEQARQVAQRVERLAQEDSEFGPRTRLGIASRRPGEQWTGTIVQEARRNVLGEGEELAS